MKKRLVSRQPDVSDAMVNGQPSDKSHGEAGIETMATLVGAAGRAIVAREVAAVGERQPQMIDAAPAAVDQLLPRVFANIMCQRLEPYME